MTITEEVLDELKDVKMHVKKNYYPVPGSKDLPRPWFVSLSLGSRSSGKTYGVVSLLQLYQKFGLKDPKTKEEMDQRIIIFSPTFEANKIFLTGMTRVSKSIPGWW